MGYTSISIVRGGAFSKRPVRVFTAIVNRIVILPLSALCETIHSKDEDNNWSVPCCHRNFSFSMNHQV